MIIENSLVVPIAPERALDMLTDVPAIAPCIPGVTITGGGDGEPYRGTAAVRLGPVALTFAGEAGIVAIDRDRRTAAVEASGADRKGRGRASARVEFALSPHGDGTRVDVRSDIALTGQVAQYGRASGLVKEVANRIIAEFTRNLEAKLAHDGGEASAAAETSAGPQAPARELSGLSVLLRALWSMIRRLFARPSGNGAKA